MCEFEHAFIFGVKLLINDEKAYMLRIFDDIYQTHFLNVINLLNEKLSDLIISSYNCSLSDDFYEIKFKNKIDNEMTYKIDNENYINMEGSTLAWLKSFVKENLV